MAHLEIGCLGTFYVSLDGDPVISFGTDKTRALLIFLVVELDRSHTRSSLAGLLWPDMPERKARHNLRQSLLTLRKTLRNEELEQPFLCITRECVQFNCGSDFWIDVEAFQDGLTAANLIRNGSDQGHPDIFKLQDALKLYRGGFLDQFNLSDSALFEEWASVQREFFARQAVNGYALLLEYHERRAEYGLALQVAHKLVGISPWEEDIHREIMNLNVVRGRHGAGLSQYQYLRRLLKDELGIEPASETTALFEKIRSGDKDPGCIQLRYTPVVYNLPLVENDLIGRKKELGELASLLAKESCRLITLHGPGGIGKTRLAVEFGYSQVGIFNHGVHFVSLTSLSTGDQVIPEIGSTLGISFVENETIEKQVANYLHNRDILLILDNFEHLVLAADLLVGMLSQAPHLVLLVTSRIRLNIQEEFVYTLHGLDFPLEKDGLGISIEDYEAVKLFLDRAQKIRYGFELASTQQKSAIFKICRLLEGIPLGIELAASNMWANTPEEVVEDLECTLDRLVSNSIDVPARHRSMRAAFESSWRLLTPQEKVTLSRLCVFNAGFDRKAAEVIVGAQASDLVGLIDKSLIHHDESGRYNIHQVVHQFASEKFNADWDHRNDVYAAHAKYYGNFLASRRDALFGKFQRRILNEVLVDIDNVRQAWKWAVEHHDREIINACVDPLYGFYNNLCRFREGVELFSLDFSQFQSGIPESLIAKICVRRSALLSHLGSCKDASFGFENSLATFEDLHMYAEEIFTLVMIANLAQRQGDWRQAQWFAEKCLERAHTHENAWGIAYGLYLSGLVHYRSGDIAVGRHQVEESLKIGRTVGDARLLGSQMYTLGDIACHQGDYDGAADLFIECFILSEELNDCYNMALHLNNLGTVHHVRGDYIQAKACYQRSFDIYRKIGDLRGQALVLSNLGEVAIAHSDLATAEGLYRQGLDIAREIPDQWVILACLNNLAELACIRDDFSHAQTLLIEAVEIAVRTNTHPMLMKLLVNLARFFAHCGEFSLARDVLQLAQEHPASETANREKAKTVAAELNLVTKSGCEVDLERFVARARSSLRNPE